MSETTLMLQPWTSREVVLVKATVLLNSITSSFMSFYLRHQKNKSGEQQLQRYVEGVDSKQ